MQLSLKPPIIVKVGAPAANNNYSRAIMHSTSQKWEPSARTSALGPLPLAGTHADSCQATDADMAASASFMENANTAVQACPVASRGSWTRSHDMLHFRSKSQLQRCNVNMDPREGIRHVAGHVCHMNILLRLPAVCNSLISCLCNLSTRRYYRAALTYNHSDPARQRQQ